MADSSAATGLTVQQWDDKFFKEYLQDNPFKAYMGTSENSIIQVKEDLTKKKGDTIHFALVNRLTNSAVTGSSTLEGNEEDMDTRSFPLTIDQRRNAVRVPVFEDQKSAIPLREAAKSVLMDWAMEDTRDLTIAAGNTISGVAYGSASEANKDAWLVDNAGRVLFGATGVGSGTDHSADLALVAASQDEITAATISKMKRMALTASPKVRPIRVGSANKRYYVMFVHPYVMRDLKADTVLTNAQRDVSIRMQNNKLFQGGDVEWDGVIVHEVDDMPILSGVGASSINVSPVYLCGAQCFGLGWGKRWQTKEEEFDYGDKQGCAVRGWYNIDQMRFGTNASTETADPVMHGMIKGYFPAVAD